MHETLNGYSIDINTSVQLGTRDNHNIVCDMINLEL